MVQCHTCYEWLHVGCALITSSIAEIPDGDFSCVRCAAESGGKVEYLTTLPALPSSNSQPSASAPASSSASSLDNGPR